MNIDSEWFNLVLKKTFQPLQTLAAKQWDNDDNDYAAEALFALSSHHKTDFYLKGGKKLGTYEWAETAAGLLSRFRWWKIITVNFHILCYAKVYWNVLLLTGVYLFIYVYSWLWKEGSPLRRIVSS